MNLVKSPKITWSEYSIFSISFLVNNLLFSAKYSVKKMAIDFIIFTPHRFSRSVKLYEHCSSQTKEIQ